MAMGSGDRTALGTCRVADGSKLSAAMNEAICAEVRHAIASAAPGTSYSIEVTVMSSSRLTAQLTLDGQVVPIQNFAVMDAQLDRQSIRRFAQSLGEVARTAKR